MRWSWAAVSDWPHGAKVDTLPRMDSPDSDHSTDRPSAADTAAAGSVGVTGWLVRALIAGAIVGIPIGWLLAFLAPMPYFLGLFFFVILGLIVGAVMCRVARPAAPIPRERMTPVSLVAALVVWSTVLVMEYRWFPDLAARKAVKMSLLSGMTEADLEAYREQVRQAARHELNTRYRPGGFAGYLRWAISSGRMELPRAGSPNPVPFQNVQSPRSWLLRIGASLALLIFAIDSQMASLAPKRVLPDDEEEKSDEAGEDKTKT